MTVTRPVHHREEHVAYGVGMILTRNPCLFIFAALILSASGMLGQAPVPQPTPETFEVATIKRVESGEKSSRFIKMEGPHRFIEKDYTLKLLIAAAYDLNPHTISGGPAWIGSDHYDIVALTPGDNQPSRDRQMLMLRSLLAIRFKLTFHREQKEFSIYELNVTKSGPKLKKSAEPPDAAPALISTVYPQRILLPARNATMGEFASLMQRAILDRPVVDKTGLSGRYDFDLEWLPMSRSSVERWRRHRQMRLALLSLPPFSSSLG